MATRFDVALNELRRNVTGQKHRAFLDDVQDQIEEDEELQGWIEAGALDRYVAVTFDRRKNDGSFSYRHLDLVLVALDAIAGGNGIYKPSSQMRALKWRAKRADLLRVLLRFRKNDRRLKFRRALILPFPLPVTGRNVDASVHLK